MNEAQARAEAAALCAQLRDRGDELSLSAAAMIEGTLDAFAGLVQDRYWLRERAESAERNLRSSMDLWHRVPAEHRLRAASQ